MDNLDNKGIIPFLFAIFLFGFALGLATMSFIMEHRYPEIVKEYKK
jgi:hypothetical protein